MANLKNLIFSLRERVRFNPFVSRSIYFGQSLIHSNFGSFRRQVLLAGKNAGQPRGVALCCRIRDEARYLEEWLEYYLAAGVEHFFFYEKLSQDNYRSVLKPYINRDLVTLFDNWPHVPVSPAAEQDCILRSIGRFEWVGFIDADEFVVIQDGRGIDEFLSQFRTAVSVALHCYVFGSGGHKKRPAGPVTAEYTRRAAEPNVHVKCFVHPECVAKYRNPHSWYYRSMRCAVTETWRRVSGSLSTPASAKSAWINHYHHKSDQDYFEKAARKSVHDIVGMRFETRSTERHAGSQSVDNAAFDDSAVRYYESRCRALSKTTVLLQQTTRPLSRLA
jgi:Glycosyltransferase family 92